MNTKLIATAIGAVLLAGSALANANGLQDVFHLLPHAERHADHRDDYHRPYVDWHREYRGFARHDAHERYRFDSRRFHDRDDHPAFVPHWHER